MPELPDITVYIEALEKRILNQTLEGVRVVSPFLLRTATPPLTSANGKKVLRLRRLGKRICIGLEDGLWLVLHLMIAGRLHWRARAVTSAFEAILQRSVNTVGQFLSNSATPLIPFLPQQSQMT